MAVEKYLFPIERCVAGDVGNFMQIVEDVPIESCTPAYAGRLLIFDSECTLVSEMDLRKWRQIIVCFKNSVFDSIVVAAKLLDSGHQAVKQTEWLPPYFFWPSDYFPLTLVICTRPDLSRLFLRDLKRQEVAGNYFAMSNVDFT
ncbi:unnamed protein product [Blumeria hordei]|uniref:Uncharacterized protein n=1 Tax=Blumeria hordei TaxID=2867405 RepID=A0A383UYI3_BLUHO|nr:unnamed protein product [Blumeria hordei]